MNHWTMTGAAVATLSCKLTHFIDKKETKWQAERSAREAEETDKGSSYTCACLGKKGSKCGAERRRKAEGRRTGRRSQWWRVIRANDVCPACPSASWVTVYNLWGSRQAQQVGSLPPHNPSFPNLFFPPASLSISTSGSHLLPAISNLPPSSAPPLLCIFPLHVSKHPIYPMFYWPTSK